MTPAIVCDWNYLTRPDHKNCIFISITSLAVDRAWWWFHLYKISLEQSVSSLAFPAASGMPFCQAATDSTLWSANPTIIFLGLRYPLWQLRVIQPAEIASPSQVLLMSVSYSLHFFDNASVWVMMLSFHTQSLSKETHYTPIQVVCLSYVHGMLQ